MLAKRTDVPLKSKIEYIAAEKLQVHPRVQRTLINAWAKQLAESLDLDALGLFTVVRLGGKLYVIDGQHRLVAIMANECGEWEVKCEVFDDLDESDAAWLFLQRNKQRRQSPWETYDKALIAEDEEVLSIDRIVSEIGLKVSHFSGDGRVSCISTLRKVHSQGPEILRESLSLATDAWGLTATAVEKSIVEGLGVVASTFNGELDRPAFVKKLAKYNGGPAGLIGRARGMTEYRSASLARCVAAVMVAHYNRGRRSGQLADL